MKCIHLIGIAFDKLYLSISKRRFRWYCFFHTRAVSTDSKISSRRINKMTTSKQEPALSIKRIIRAQIISFHPEQSCLKWNSSSYYSFVLWWVGNCCWIFFFGNFLWSAYLIIYLVENECVYSCLGCIGHTAALARWFCRLWISSRSIRMHCQLFGRNIKGPRIGRYVVENWTDLETPHRRVEEMLRRHK